MNSAEFALVVAAAAAVSFGIVIALLPLLQRYALAHPNARSSHRKSTPQGGGIAVIAATIVIAAGVLALLPEPSFDAGSLGLVLAAAAFIAAVGAWDDVRSIRVGALAGLQAFAVGIVIAGLPSELHVVAVLPWW